MNKGLIFMAELFADKGTDYAEFVFDELTKLNGYQKQNLDNVMQINVGDLNVNGVWPWRDEEYPKQITFRYEAKPLNWQRFKDSVINNNEIVKKYKIRDEEHYQITKLVQEGSQKDSILLEIEFMGDALKFEHKNNINKLSATITGTTEATMVDGIETVMNLSVPFGISVTPFMKTPSYAFDYYGKYNIRKEAAEILA